jgi:crotonobetainyl-CoA:carnitine CoA-transferase CaiB-like acyl-CoA transferase
VPDAHHAIAPYGVFVCGDGERVLIAIEQDAEWQRLCRDVLDDPALAAEPAYARNVDRLEHREQLQRVLAERFAARSVDELVAALDASGLAYGRANDVAQVSEHEVLAHRGAFVDCHSAEGTAVRRLAGIAERQFGRPLPRRDRPPALGEDTEAVLSELSETQQQPGDD